MAARTFAIAFDFPEGTMYAGKYKDGLGWAPTLSTAILFQSEDSALAMIQNGYGESGKWAKVVTVSRTGVA